MEHDRCYARWLASRMSGVIVMSDNSPHREPGEPSKTRPSAPARLASTRHNDTFCLVFCIFAYCALKTARHILSLARQVSFTYFMEVQCITTLS